jgi:hypothetical protein
MFACALNVIFFTLTAKLWPLLSLLCACKDAVHSQVRPFKSASCLDDAFPVSIYVAATKFADAGYAGTGCPPER